MDNVRHRYAPHATGHGVNYENRTADEGWRALLESPVRTLIIVAVAVICTPASVMVGEHRENRCNEMTRATEATTDDLLALLLP